MNDEYEVVSLLHSTLDNVRTNHKREPFSNEFIFGNAPDNTRLRNRLIARVPEGRMTLLSAMLRFGLDEQQRAYLFPSAFELGSLKSIPADKLSLTYLAQKVRKERRQRDDVATRKKEFETITRAIKKMTGRRFGDYADKQAALRVIYLFDKLMSHSSHGRQERFLTFIKAPTTKFSFEMRDDYPTSDSEANSFLLNDLRGYVSIDIEPNTLKRIDGLFYALIGRFDRARERVDALAYSAPDRAGIADNYRHFIDQIDRINLSSFKDPQATRLDQDIYVHLQKLEFMHFAGSFREVFKRAIPPSRITPIADLMVGVLSQITDGRRSHRDVAFENFWLDAFGYITNTYKALFVELIDRALGWTPSEKDYVRSTTLAGELLFRVKLFASDVPVPRSEIRISFRDIVSALCTVTQALRHRTLYRPQVFRDTGQTRSIITRLEKPLDVEDLDPAKTIPEGYLQVWHHRKEWVQAALADAQDLVKLKFALRAKLFEKALFCMTFNDIEVIEASIQTLEASLSDLRPSQALGN